MRLFIAINFDEDTKKNMLAVQQRLKAWGKGSFSRPENLHLTLAFLGEVAAERVGEIQSILDQLNVPRLRLLFNHVGYFQRRDGDIWWIGLEHNQGLFALQKELHQLLTAAGFPLDNRPFSPHVTLARRVRLHREPDKNQLLGTPFTTTADTVSLMLSERVDGKLTYTELYSVTGGSR